MLQNEQLDEELHNSVSKKILKSEVYFPFKCNIWGDDLADMHLISKFNKATRLLLCDIDIFSKHVWVVPLIDKKKL